MYLNLASRQRRLFLDRTHDITHDIAQFDIFARQFNMTGRDLRYVHQISK